MSLDEILKVKQEIMDMIYNVGFIFLATPIFLQGIRWVVSMLMYVAGFQNEVTLYFELLERLGPSVLVTRSITWSGFITMMYMAYKMMDLKDISLVSFVRVLAKVIYKSILRRFFS